MRFSFLPSASEQITPLKPAKEAPQGAQGRLQELDSDFYDCSSYFWDPIASRVLERQNHTTPPTWREPTWAVAKHIMELNNIVTESLANESF